MRSDEELMKAVSNGEIEAFEELVRRYESMAIKLANKLLSDSKYSEDVAQEAFLKILRNADNYEPSASFRTYLSRVIERLCYDRSDKNEPIQVDPAENSIGVSSRMRPLDKLLDDERKIKIQNALDELADRQRTAIILQHFEGFTYEEIADSMDTSKKSVERLLARARENLRSELIEDHDFNQNKDMNPFGKTQEQ